MDPIRNSLKLFENWGVLECHNEQNTKIYYLKEAYDNDEDIDQIYSSVEIYKWTKVVD